MPDISAKWILKHNFDADKNFVGMGVSAGVEPIYIVSNKQHPSGEDAAIKFKNGMKNILENGTYKTILKKHQVKGEAAIKQIERLQQYQKNKIFYVL